MVRYSFRFSCLSVLSSLLLLIYHVNCWLLCCFSCSFFVVLCLQFHRIFLGQARTIRSIRLARQPQLRGNLIQPQHLHINSMPPWQLLLSLHFLRMLRLSFHSSNRNKCLVRNPCLRPLTLVTLERVGTRSRTALTGAKWITGVC